MKRKFKCPYCEYAPSRKWNLKKHLISVHRVESFKNDEIQDDSQFIQSELLKRSHCTLYLFSGVGLTVEFACSNRFSMFKRKFGNDKYKLHIDISVHKLGQLPVLTGNHRKMARFHT